MVNGLTSDKWWGQGSSPGYSDSRNPPFSPPGYSVGAHGGAVQGREEAGGGGARIRICLSSPSALSKNNVSEM